jgi:GrpB-like predicted nucleotidyltransferase (UPF0157 family)
MKNYLQINISLILRNIILLLVTPKDFLYSFTYSPTKKVDIKNYDPNCKKISNAIIHDLKKVAPSLKIHYVGSSSLGIIGEHDIDLVAGISYKKFGNYLPALTAKFGRPNNKREKFIEWKIVNNGYNIEFSIIDPTHDAYKRKLNGIKALRENPKILKQYKFLKMNSQEVSEREYDRRKLWFFIKVRYRHIIPFFK